MCFCSPEPGTKTRRTRPTKFDVPPEGWKAPEGWVPGMPCPEGYPPNSLGDLTPANAGNVPIAPGQQTRHARRLYVGNLPARVDEEQIRRYFEDIVDKALTEPLPGGGSPVLSVYLNRDRRFGFVEFATIELTTACMALDGIDFYGNLVRIRRPNDYAPESLPEDTRDKAAPLNLQALSDKLRVPVQDIIATLPKLYIANIPPQMTEQALQEIFEPFGELQGVKIGRDAMGQSKGIALVQYKDTSQHNAVVENMNGLEVGDMRLQVSHASVPQQEEILPTAGMGTTAGSGSRGAAAAAALVGMNDTPANPPVGQGHGGAAAVSALFGESAQPQSQTSSPTRVLKLGNMITEQDLSSEEEYRDIYEDIRAECAQYGKLNKLVLPREGPGKCSAFLEYSTPQEAQEARNNINGRTFGGQLVSADFYDEGKFQREDFSG